MTDQFFWFQLQMNSYSSNWNTTLLKSDCHSLWIWKMHSGREDSLEERYAIKFCFKLRKNATATYRMLQTAFLPSCMNRSSVFEWHKIEEMKEAVTKVIDILTQEDFHGAFQKLLEQYNKCIAAGWDYFVGD